jgi:quinone-modifying oxidoreductase subunit QmoA
MSNAGPASQTILVVGGGIAGITAAVEVAEAGHDVVLLERGPALGGRVAQLHRYFPKLCPPACGLEINYQRIRTNPRIRLFTLATVAGVSGERGNFSVTVKTFPRYVNVNCTACGDCAKATDIEVADPFNLGMRKVKAAYLPHEHAFPLRYVIAPEAIGTPVADKIKAACNYDAVDLEEQEASFDLNVGAMIWATGWKPYDAGRIDEYAYGRNPDVITNMEMERLANHNGPTGGKILRPSNGQPAKHVALIQCAGSRDNNHLPYCSAICCLGSLKHAAYLREQYADAHADIYYIDIRAHGKHDNFFNRLRADPQVRFVKSKPGSIEEDQHGNPVVRGEDTITREIYERPYDLVVLATGMEPTTALDYKLPVALDLDDYGFIAPAPADGNGMFAAGVAMGPIDVTTSVQSATAAALRAIQAVRGSAAR